jgi:transposase, IS5 family
MIEAKRLQRSFGDGLIAEEIEDLRETWMRHVDVVLQDEMLLSAVHQALSSRYPNSRRYGRPGYPAEVVLRLLILKHIRNWSYAVLEREVRANLVYRDFTRVGAGKMPDAKTMGRWGVALGPGVIKGIHDRIVQIALAQKVVQGRKMRVDTTVVESNIHYPTDSSLLGDGVRVLTQHAQDHRVGRHGRREVARSEPQREVANAGDCPGSTRQSPAKPGQTEGGLPQSPAGGRPCGGTGQTLLTGDR